MSRRISSSLPVLGLLGDEEEAAAVVDSATAGLTVAGVVAAGEVAGGV